MLFSNIKINENDRNNKNLQIFKHLLWCFIGQKKHICPQVGSMGVVAFWGCFAAGGADAPHNLDSNVRKEIDVEILKQHLKKSAMN